MKCITRLMFCILLGLICGCGSRTPVPPAPAPAAAAGAAPEARELDIGDIETSVALEGKPAPGTENSGISVDNLTGRGDSVVLTTVRLKPPYPTALPFAFHLGTTKDLGGRVVAVRLSVMRAIGDKEEQIGRFAAVLSGRQATTPALVARPMDITIDLLAGLAVPADQILVHVNGELVLLPQGTPADAVDPETATAVAGDISNSLQSNPIRIEFLPG